MAAVAALVVMGTSSALWIAACGAKGEDPATEFSAELALSGDQPAGLKHELNAGVYLVEIRERAIDVRTSVEAPGVHSELQDRTPRHGSRRTNARE